MQGNWSYDSIVAMVQTKCFISSSKRCNEISGRGLEESKVQHMSEPLHFEDMSARIYMCRKVLYRTQISINMTFIGLFNVVNII